MDAYKIPIGFAFIVFPFIAFILTIPFLIHQYRKYGAIPLLKSLCFYSLILYLICAYFLVILPLPSIEDVRKMTSPTTQLHMFQFIKDIITTNNFNIKEFSDIFNILKSPTVYTVLFNIVLTLPFGVYLRYFFQKKWYHTFTYTFFLSLFFELTQLSGLYGIYPRPYRLFDIDDLLINTLGGMIGYMITPLLTIFLPTREELEAKSYKKGKKVTLLRRFVSFSIDIFFLTIFSLITKILLYSTPLDNYHLLLTIFIYYILIPTFSSGKTLGKKILRLKIESLNAPAKWYQILFRNVLLIGIVLYPNIWINNLNLSTAISNRLWSVIVICQIVNILYYFFTFSKENHLFLYEQISRTKNISTIENDYTLSLAPTQEASKETTITSMQPKLALEKNSENDKKSSVKTKKAKKSNCKKQ